MGNKSKISDIFECNEYIEKLTPDEKKWIQKFYKEYYFADFYNDEENIITDPVVKSEAIKNHNMKASDFLLAGLNDSARNKTEFMESASDTWEVDNAYSVGGIEIAINMIMDHTTRDLFDNKELDENLTLARFYVKMEKIMRKHLKLIRKQKRQEKK